MAPYLSNELIFLTQILIIYLAIIVCARLGSLGLVACIITQSLCANLFVLKQIVLFGFTVTGTDAYTIGSMLSLNLLQELYGKEYAKKTIFINFFMLFFYLLTTLIQLEFSPSMGDMVHLHYCALLQITPRLISASLFSFFISQLIDYLLYGYYKAFYSKIPLLFRNYASVALSQLIDTVLFTFLAFSGLNMNIVHLIVFSYLIKLIAIFLLTPSTTISIKLINKFGQF